MTTLRVYAAWQEKDFTWCCIVTDNDTISDRGVASNFSDALDLARQNWHTRKTFKIPEPQTYEKISGRNSGKRVTLDDL